MAEEELDRGGGGGYGRPGHPDVVPVLHCPDMVRFSLTVQLSSRSRTADASKTAAVMQTIFLLISFLQLD